jgi:hypothetical protein
VATARTLIAGAFTLCGVIQPGETVDADNEADAFRRLNQLASTWKTQSLAALVVERYLFNLTANQQSYSIGPGGEFDIPRPQSVQGAGLLLNGLSSPQSITLSRVSTTATATVTDHGFEVGQEVLIDGATETGYNGLQTIASVPDADTFTYAVYSGPASPATGSPTVQTYDGTPTEIPRAMLTDDAYQAIQIKTLTNSQFTNVYYNATQPLGTIWLWPIPNISTNQLVLYVQSQFGGFADLTTDYTFVDVAGWADAYEYNLARRLLAPYGVSGEVAGDIRLMATSSLGAVKRQNYKLSDLAIDPALTGNRMGGYNILTGSGGGA